MSHHYIKKEDAADLLQRQYYYFSFVFFLFAIGLAYLYYFMLPKIVALYTAADMEISSAHTVGEYVLPVVALIFFAVALWYMRKKVDTVALNNRLKQFESKEMILVSTVIDRKESSIVLFGSLALLAVGILTVILPIYQLSNAL